MNEYVLYQPCITSWSIVLFHPTNLSFSQRLINYGPDSVSNYDLIANQSTSNRGRTLLGVWSAWTHTHTIKQACQLSASTFFLVSGIMGKFLATVIVSLWGQWYWSMGLSAVNTRVWSEISLQRLDGSPQHLVQTTVVQGGLSRGWIV